MTRDIPLRLVSEQNAREHWRVRDKRARAQRGLVALVLRGACADARKALSRGQVVVVTLQRLMGPRARAFDAHDNLPANFKHVADAIAEDVLGVKDNDRRLVWQYADQVRHPTHAVRVTVEAR